MAVLRFSFGTMGSGKSTFALQIHHNLSRRSKKGLLLAQFGRDGAARVSSRLGASQIAAEVTPELDLFGLAARYASDHGGIDYVVCDETQFFTERQADELATIVDVLGADVYAFGLLTDFRGKLFAATQRLLELADERIELQVEARCWCGERATHNARLVNGTMVHEGEVVVVGDVVVAGADDPVLFGDSVRYELVCRRHFRSGDVGPSTG
jgi:thymidine kinase